MSIKGGDFIIKKTESTAVFVPEEWNEEFLSVHNCIILSSVMVEKELFIRLGGFRGLPRLADYDCWLNLIKVTDLLYIDEPLFYYDGAHGSGQYY